MWFYNLIILVWALVSLRKKHWGTIRARFVGPSIPKKTTYRIWVHAVSLGEAKSVLPLLERFPEAEILFSTTTKTGFSIAKQFPHAFYLPLDLSWIMRRLSKAIDPDLFILVETDIWLNLLRAIKAPKVLVNGRLSKRSLRLYRYIPSLLRRLDLICVQSDAEKDRFAQLGLTNIHVTGNLKLDSTPHYPETSLAFPSQAITIALTHEGEEECILNHLPTHYPIMLAPRHPERFSTVANLIKRFPHKITLIDQVGVMDHCYKHSRAVIMGGSFVPGIGGHNIFEPLRHGLPVFYGPYMHAQESLLNSLEGWPHEQVTLDQLASRLEKRLQEPAQRMVAGGGTEKTYEILQKLLVKKGEHLVC